MYARGMITREIQGHLMEIYGWRFLPTSSLPSPTRFYTLSWQNRPLPIGVFRYATGQASGCLRCAWRDA